ncbi:MAG: phosphoribosylformylglycinamidine cyclo-ligase [Candidatus Caldatribacteriota bacterium]|nr:phosphoribosylformylglycinamidine cyclo-ligase [Atribacterota bacterium]MDD3031381.1 phosphoribosylformylglycinamidine cyclo-ligase [Atribacterota bacterium]MDD4289632.1 phosphoribosylformylglycinamidine cyclo-ligase [Atribacterota bacterium]MDD4765238.1 phosphoribosylformylglycinamidine cyclo-ligase [Atribacterota bacterium]
MKDAYKKSGVDIDLANSIINNVKPMIHSTHIPGVMNDIGSFAGLFSISQEKIKDPVLVSGTDGVGTKLMIANLMEKHDTIGIDLVAMCVNDILTCGAKPIFFLDYLATGKLEKGKMVAIIKGITDGCKEAGCALLGGETAEMPGFYPEGEYDLSGFSVGIVERDKIISGKNIKPEDVILGLASSGLHSNGFSLVRKVLLQEEGIQLRETPGDLKVSLGEELLRPTKIYVKSILSIIEKFSVKGIVHITGGGFYDNIPRILPDNTIAEIYIDSWQKLPIFQLLQNKGKLTDKEMYRTFNMGIGLIIIVPPEQKESIIQELENLGEIPYFIGKVSAGDSTDNRVNII